MSDIRDDTVFRKVQQSSQYWRDLAMHYEDALRQIANRGFEVKREEHRIADKALDRYRSRIGLKQPQK